MKKHGMYLLIMLMAFGLAGCEKPETDDPIIDVIDVWDRSDASNYEEGIPMVENTHVIYINWDGFARYYYDDFIASAVNETMPTLQKLLSEGVFFENLHTTLPSITNPCQNMILSGSTSAITGNVYRYYNKTTNAVVQQARENLNKTIGDVAVEANMSVASVSHYLLEPVLTKGVADTYYITPSAEAGEGAIGRFDELIKLVKGEPVNVGGTAKAVSELPRFTALYVDDLDALGHNFGGYYGYEQQYTEAGRIRNVLARLKTMDQKLGELIQACKDMGIYDEVTFFLTTDHGMAPYGLTSLDDVGDYGTTKLGDLQAFFKNYNSDYIVEMVPAGSSPRATTSVVAVGANLNLQLTWKKGITDEELEAIKTELEKEKYVGVVLTRSELEAMGYMTSAADMVVTPAERYIFSSNFLATYVAKGQHDSMLDAGNHIYGIIWGKGIKKNVVYEETAFNFDFGVTMAATLGLVIPNANGVVLDVFEGEE